MNLTITPVRSQTDHELFVHFPWKVYKGDKFWTPPLITARRDRLDPQRNPFWKTAERELWLARRGETVVGTISAFWSRDNPAGGVGYFGFFEVLNDAEAAVLLQDSAAEWLRQKGAGSMRGPYNPSRLDEAGILIYGFNTRPALLEGHSPAYYAAFFETNGFYRHSDLLARICKIPAGVKTVEEGLPERLTEIQRRVLARRPDLVVRTLDFSRWKEEIDMACDLYNRSLVDLPDFMPVPLEEFHQLAEGFKPILSVDLAWIAELAGKPVGFVLALPDANEALQPLNGRLGPLDMLSFSWRIRHAARASFKILVMLPEYKGRGIESVLIYRLSQGILKHKFREVDMSLTGDVNPKSTLFQDQLGFKIYRRCRIYQKEL